MDTRKRHEAFSHLESVGARAPVKPSRPLVTLLPVHALLAPWPWLAVSALAQTHTFIIHQSHTAAASISISREIHLIIRHKDMHGTRIICSMRKQWLPNCLQINKQTPTGKGTNKYVQ